MPSRTLDANATQISMQQVQTFTSDISVCGMFITRKPFSAMIVKLKHISLKIKMWEKITITKNRQRGFIPQRGEQETSRRRDQVH